VDVNGKDATGPLQITTTNDAADLFAWRQWHHWNLAYFDFKPVHRRIATCDRFNSGTRESKRRSAPKGNWDRELLHLIRQADKVDGQI